ncbi:MAG: PAS domain S-box protein [Candidatus Eisenbacteria bacterium]|uniref:histidine kinase n=1 Tax=Eiseniibacteriota bacterium TaxID=2212470 RepID=A0A956NFN7_UNCEI|nr:PAS domain S-box protein [Candidatus Eisenbacteria bacterium]
MPHECLTDADSATLSQLLPASEEWLMERILWYADQFDYTRYTSTLKEAWRLSIVGLTNAILGALERSREVPELGPDDEFQQDPVSRFGLIEAQLHRARGVSLSMFLGLMKYYRQCYLDLLETWTTLENRRATVRFIERCFDRTEIAFCVEWSGIEPESQIRELAAANRRLANEKNKYQTIFESHSNAMIVTTPDGRIDDLNLSAKRLLGIGTEPGSVYYGKHGKRDSLAELETRIQRIQDQALHGGTGELLWSLPDPRTRVSTPGAESLSAETPGVENLSTEPPVESLSAETPGVDSPSAETPDAPVGEGALRVFNVGVAQMLDVSGKFAGITVTMNDITERKRTEVELEGERDFAESLIDTAPAIVLVLDLERRIVRFNRYMEELTGYRSEDVSGREWFELCLPERDREKARGRFDRLVQGASVLTTTSPIRAHDGRTHEIEWHETVLRRGEGPVTGVLAVGLDITERAVLQSQLSQAQKLESIGQLAAGIAHEINTPTQFIGDNLRFLREAFGELLPVLGRVRAESLQGKPVETADERSDDIDFEYLSEEVPSAIDQALEGVERVATIVRSMKEFSHPGRDKKEPADLNRAIENTITVARNEWKYVAETVTEFDPNLPSVPVLINEFNQVILNLVINAAHAIQEAGGGTKGPKGTIRVSTQSSGDHVEIRVTDTGTGMSDDVRERAFDPFFTTKPVGRGTGQGLAIARGVIVNKHAGTIDIESELGRGTTFLIRLPIEPGAHQVETEDRAA